LPDIQPGSLVYPFSFPVYCFFFILNHTH
jgi:hypothetical protein